MKWLSKFQKADVWSEPAWRKGVFGSALPTQTVGELPPGRDGFIVQARSLEALFVNAAQTLFTSIATPREGAELQPMDTRSVRVAANNSSELMVNWLNVLVALFRRNGFWGTDFEVYEFDDQQLMAEVSGRQYRPEDFELLTLVDRVAHDGLSIRKYRGLWHAVIIIDT